MTTKITFASPVVKAALATLQAGLPAQIAVFNAESQNTVDLTTPVAYVYGADDPLGVAGFPVVEVAAATGTGHGSSVSLGTVGSDFDHQIQLTVVCWHEGDRGELPTTYEMSLGMARCIIELLLVDGALGATAKVAEDATGPLFTWRTDALPADLTSDAREFTKWRVPVFIQFAVMAVETFA